MVNPDIIFGRLGNRMFQMATLYAYCKTNNFPFYVQDEKYFKPCEKEIRQLYGDDIVPNSINQVAIHVRRGKNPINPEEPAYAENPFYVTLEEYYERAMALFPTDDFLVFSDDIEWCNEQEMFKGCEFYHGTEVEDLNMMASCKHIIGANSSYSWWASWLGDYIGRKIVTPARWFTDIENEKLIGIPNHWIQI